MLAEYLRFRDGFAEAVDERFYPIAYLDALVAAGRALIWSTDNSAIAAEIRTYPSGLRDIHGLCATGDMHEIIEALIPAAEEWAIANGCAGAVVESREGWVRALRPYGYEPFQTAVRKQLMCG